MSASPARWWPGRSARAAASPRPARRSSTARASCAARRARCGSSRAVRPRAPEGRGARRARGGDSAAAQAHHRLGVALTGGGAGGEYRLDGGEVFVVETHAERADVFLEVTDPPRAGNRHDVFSLRQYPGKRQLRRRAVLLARQLPYLIDECQVAAEVLALKARGAAAIVIGREIVRALDGAGEEAASERAVRHETDAETPAGLEHVVLGIARPQRVLALQ